MKKPKGLPEKEGKENKDTPVTPTRSRSGARPDVQLQDTFRLSADGLAKVLGDLEARIMRAIWEIGRSASAREVHAVVVQEHNVQPLTVITVLNNLVQKGLLGRAKYDALYHYHARWSEAEFLESASRRVVEGVLALDPDVVAASFVNVLAERDPEQLSVLNRLIQQRLSEQDRGSKKA